MHTPLPPVHITAHDKVRGRNPRFAPNIELRVFVDLAGHEHRVGTLCVSALQYRLIFRPWLLQGAKATNTVVTLDETHAPSLRGAP